MALGTVQNSVNITITYLLELNFYAQKISLIFLPYSVTYLVSKFFVSSLHLQHIPYGGPARLSPCYNVLHTSAIAINSNVILTFHMFSQLDPLKCDAKSRLCIMKCWSLLHVDLRDQQRVFLYKCYVISMVL
jgi:hypothetical protein